MSYLNTCPLVWGFLHGPTRDSVDLRFELPSACARSLESGEADIGLVPVIEMFRQGLEVVSDVCIASDGPVRSIFLLYRGAVNQIRSLALDSSSRTSVALTKIILAERYGIHASEHEMSPDPQGMLSGADAALIIGDPALRLEPASADYSVLDLGQEWQALTGLPMVYAVWAGRGASANPDLFRQSYDYGRTRISEIVKSEAAPRHIPEELAERYLTRNIRYELSLRASQGLNEFKRLAQKHGLLQIDSIPPEMV